MDRGQGAGTGVCRRRLAWQRAGVRVAVLGLLLCGQVQPAQAFDLLGAVEDYYTQWIDMVHRTHEYEQPDWMTPLVTVIPTLQQEIRTDYFFTEAPHGLQTYSYLTKGTEIIPTENTEVILGNPTYIERNKPAPEGVSGFGDWGWVFKYRILASPSNADNYVLMFLLTGSADTGQDKYISANHNIYNPLLGFGKGWDWGWGEFDYQGTVGPVVPDGAIATLGTPVAWNSVFQYRLRIATPFLPNNPVSTLWPEFETTWFSYPNGAHPGQQQLYLTVGAIAGRFALSEHGYFVLGLGYQFAVTQARLYNHQWLVTMRIPFF
jgi:hypothetical protein